MENYISVLSELGKRIQTELLPNLSTIAQQSLRANPWFTQESIALSLSGWVHALQRERVEKWLIGHKPVKKSLKVGVVAAGNIPLVGLHDFLCVLVSGHTLLYKKSQNDQFLIEHMFGLLKEIDPSLADKVFFVDKLKDMDAVIATGSNNTSRYFEYYFSKVPNIIRKNRTSVAVLSGSESLEEYESLAGDIFSYYGLGCRNVSKLYIPQEYDLLRLLPILEQYKEVMNNNKYMNNYDYNRTMLLMNQHPFYDTANAILVESERLHSSVSVLHYQRYDALESVKKELKEHSEEIQCIVSKSDIGLNKVDFGQTQYPDLWDYADNINVLQFLTNI